MSKSAILLFLFFSCASLNAAELSFQHREAERLYNNGDYAAANKKAELLLQYFPNDLQALIIAGRSQFYRENYLEAGKLFVRAMKQSPRHPIILRYSELLQEINYRTNIGAKITFDDLEPSQYTRAEYFKRGYFGTGFTHLSRPAIDPPTTAPTVLLTPYPSQESILTNNFVEYLAKKAYKEGNYHKAYLFYGQLLASNPNNRGYLLGKAESSFYMKRYKQVIKIIGPISTATGLSGFLPDEKIRAEKLIDLSRSKIYSE